MKNHTLSLQYLIKAPKNTNKKAPLLLMLHGYGSDEKDLFSFAQELPEDVFIVSARAPFVIEPVGNAWYAIHWNTTTEKFSDTEQAKKSVALIANFIDELITNYPIDKNNVSLLGFSQGSILRRPFAKRYSNKKLFAFRFLLFSRKCRSSNSGCLGKKYKTIFRPLRY